MGVNLSPNGAPGMRFRPARPSAPVALPPQQARLAPAQSQRWRFHIWVQMR